MKHWPEIAKASIASESMTGIAHPTITKIVQGKRTITADTALRFARFFGTTPGFWLNLQKSYDIEEAELKSGKKIEIEVKPLVPA